MNRPPILLAILMASTLAGCAAPIRYDPYLHDRDISMRIVSGYAAFNRDYLAAGNNEATLLLEAQKTVSQSMKDPASAQFRSVRATPYQDGVVVCGEVNARNSYGGYTGFKRFAATSEAAMIDRTETAQVDARSLGIYDACSN